MAEETPRQHTTEELAAIELRHALAGMGPDTDRALMVTLRLPDGTFVADIWLSTADVTALTDGALAMSLVAHTEHQLKFSDIAAGPLPIDEGGLDVDGLNPADIADLTGRFDAILNDEDGQA